VLGACLLLAPGVVVAAPQERPVQATGFDLLRNLVELVDRAGRASIDADALSAGILGLARDLKATRDAKRIDPLFAARYSRLLSGVRQAVASDPELLFWPMYRFTMFDFIEERTGRMPEWEKLLFTVRDHGGSPVGLATIVEAVMAEVVSLHIHLETLDRRDAVLASYLRQSRPPQK
jgi:hypothetical protein